MNRLRTAAHRAPIFLGLGSVLATGAAAPGCRTDTPPATQTQGASEKGVRTVVSEVTPGRYVIDEEVLVDTATQVVVRRLDGTAERITDPERFAALLPPPDSVRALAPAGAAAPGGGGSWDAAPPAGEAADSTRVRARPGFPFGMILFYSLAMNAWRPRAYGGLMASAPPAAYRNDLARDRSRSTGGGLLAAQRAGQAPAGLDDARSRRVARTRAAQPSGGRSGYGRTWGRSGGA
jgi:hypothetical protein